MIRGWDYNNKKAAGSCLFKCLAQAACPLEMSGVGGLRFSNLVLIAVLYQIDGSKYNMGEPKTNDGI